MTKDPIEMRLQAMARRAPRPQAGCAAGCARPQETEVPDRQVDRAGAVPDQPVRAAVRLRPHNPRPSRVLRRAVEYPAKTRAWHQATLPQAWRNPPERPHL